MKPRMVKILRLAATHLQESDGILNNPIQCTLKGHVAIISATSTGSKFKGGVGFKLFSLLAH